MSGHGKSDAHSVAITGLSCRFPGDGNNLDNFWESICRGKSAWSEIPKSRFNVDAFHSTSDNVNTSIARGAHFLKQDVSKFDANFFSLSKAEADSMDPQQRLMIEVAYEALEKASLSLEDIAGTKTGVFCGHFTNDYRDMVIRDPEIAPKYTTTGTCKTSLANRISWLFDLKGPSFSLDTACSSSLVAFHLACQSLRTGESDIAIVGGVSLLLNPEMFMYFSNQNFLSPDGKCKSFDISGNGYGRGEGIAAIVLKRVDDAVAGQDPIRAVIRGTGSNQDGHTKGFTLPSADAQSSLINETYRLAGLDFKDTHYVEAHGTGTQAGDTEETSALARTISAEHSFDNRLYIGSVKSNIGHLEACAGLAGIVKSVLILENGVIPPTINHKKGNPKIKFDEWSLEVPTSLTPWPTSGVRRISVNSFGYGGTNAHVILDDAYHYLQGHGLGGNSHTTNNINNGDTPLNGVGKAVGDSPRLFTFSAQDKEGLRRIKHALADHLDNKMKDPNVDSAKYLADLSYTLSRKTVLQWRTSIIASSFEDLLEELRDDDNTSMDRASSAPRIGFIFTGQGAQWPQMGMELMEYPVFKESVQAADDYLTANCECSWSAKEELTKGKSSSRLHLAEFSQTLCTVLQVATVDLLRTWGLSPVAVAGHSSGEIGAAYCLGALTREDAWKAAYYRGVLSTALKTLAPELAGSMMAVGASAEQAQEWIVQVQSGEVVVACVNSPTSVTLSGDTDGIDELAEMLTGKGVFARKLKVDTAYHSPHMQMIAQDYYEAIADIETRSRIGTCTMHSSVTGGGIEPSELGAANWVRNLTFPVQFAAAVYDLVRPIQSDGSRSEDNAIDMLIEIGPHSALQGPATQTLKTHGIKNVPYESVLKRDQNGVNTALNLAGAVFAQGGKMDFIEVNNDRSIENVSLLVDLPSYAWSHSQGYWAESRIAREYQHRKQPRLSLIGAPAPTFAQGEYTWRKFIKLSEEPWISDHQIQASVVYPGAGYLAMAFEAAYQIADPQQKVAGFQLRDVQLTAAAVISEDFDLEIMVSLRPHFANTRNTSSGWMEFVVTTSPDAETLQRNCSGLILIEYEAAKDSPMSLEQELESKNLQAQYLEAATSCRRHVAPVDFYHDLTTLGLIYGPVFANVTEIRSTAGKSFCAVDIPETPMKETYLSGERPHIIHPGTLDAMFHAAFAAVQGGENEVKQAMVPRTIEQVFVSATMPYQPKARLSGFSTADKYGLKELKADITMFAEADAHPAVRIVGFTCTEIGSSSSAADNDGDLRKLCSKLTWRPAIDLLTGAETKRVLSESTCPASTHRFERVSGSEKVEASGLESEGVKSIPSQLGEYLRLLHFANPELSILEISTQPDGTQPALLVKHLPGLDALLETARYTISGPNGDALLKLREELSSFEDNVEFAVFDADNSLEAQELKEKNFDVVIVSDLVKAVKHPDIALRNARELLKKGGKFCAVQQGASAESRTNTLEPSLSRNGLNLSFKVGDIENGQAEMLVAQTASETVASFSDKDIVIVQPADASARALAFGQQLSVDLEKDSFQTTIFSWGSDVSHLKDKQCISLLELEKPLLNDLNEEGFTSLKSAITETKELLWIVGFDDPCNGMVNGLARVVRNEIPGISFRTAQTDFAHESSPEESTSMIARVFKSKTLEDELRIQNGIISVSRIEEDIVTTKEVENLMPNARDRINRVPLAEVGSPQKLCIQTQGMLDSLCFEADDLPLTQLEDDQIEIDVKATALNSRDSLVVTGQIHDKLLGFDAAGIIRRVGSAVTNFCLGDHVVMYGNGAHRTVHRSKAEFCALIPEGLSFEQAATIPLVHGTAWYGLIKLAQVRKGQTILIHAAAGGVGQAAIQIAQHFDMEILATVGSETKRKLLRDTYRIPDDHILSSRDLSFARGVNRITKGRGVDVVLNSLTGEAVRQTLQCVASFGTFIEIGIKDEQHNPELDMRPFFKDATYTCFNINHIERERPEIMAEIIAGTFEFQRRKITRPISPLTVYPVSEVESAFRSMQAGQHVGKLALTFSDTDVVPVLSKNAESFQLDPNAAYLIVGGFGGLGRSLSTMLVDQGARKLCFLSRSGGSSAEAQKLIHDLEERRVNVKAYACDIADAVATSKAISTCQTELGPIRGVIQCAMLLRDVLFSKMSYAEWIQSTRPKIQGSWNLHENLKDVDFFVCLSSFAATFGNRGQSNYAAGCAFQDALAYHRRSLRLHAVTLDVGQMREVGVLAEKGMTDSLREWEEPYGILEGELHGILKRVIGGDMKGDIAPQVLTGLATGGSAIAAGISTPFYLEDNARFSIMAQTGVQEAQRNSAESGDQSATLPTHVLVSKAASIQEATEHIAEALVRRVAKMLQMPVSEIDTGRALHAYGVDSLTSIEIVNWALKELKATVSVIDIMAGVPILKTAGKIAAGSALLQVEGK